MTSYRLIALLLGSCLSLPAETYRLEGEPYHTSAPIVWSDSATNIPSSVRVYKVIPQQFSMSWLSNVVSLEHFK